MCLVLHMWTAQQRSESRQSCRDGGCIQAHKRGRPTGIAERFHACRFDALAGYLSALLRGDSGSNGSGGGLDAAAAGGWPATHIIGKDILRFHAVSNAAVVPSTL